MCGLSVRIQPDLDSADRQSGRTRVEPIPVYAVRGHGGSGEAVGGGEVAGGEVADAGHSVGEVDQFTLMAGEVGGAHGVGGQVAADYDGSALAAGPSEIVEGLGLPGGAVDHVGS